MRLLALDLGSKLGWALDVDGQVFSGTEDLAPMRSRRFDSPGMRYLRFAAKLYEWAPDRVVYEEVRRHLGVDAAHVYGGFLSHLQAYCDPKHLEYEGVPVAHIKRFATGKGNASKDQVIDAVKGLGFSPVDDNEADALALLALAKIDMIKDTKNEGTNQETSGLGARPKPGQKKPKKPVASLKRHRKGDI